MHNQSFRALSEFPIRLMRWAWFSMSKVQNQINWVNVQKDLSEVERKPFWHVNGISNEDRSAVTVALLLFSCFSVFAGNPMVKSSKGLWIWFCTVVLSWTALCIIKILIGNGRRPCWDLQAENVLWMGKKCWSNTRLNHSELIWNKERYVTRLPCTYHNHCFCFLYHFHIFLYTP